MKSIVCLIFSLLISSLIFCQSNSVNKLIVEGNADLIIESERASFDFSLLGFGSTLRDAVADVKSKVSEAMKVLSLNGISKKSVSTSSFEGGENFNGKAFLSSSKDFKTQMSVFVIVDSLSKLEEIIVSLSEIGIQSIGNINYSLVDFTKYQMQARDKALEDAKIKAKTMADKLGIILKKVIHIEDGGSYQNYPTPFNPATKIMNEILTTASTLFAKPVKISQRIKVIYEIE